MVFKGAISSEALAVCHAAPFAWPHLEELLLLDDGWHHDDAIFTP
jgi:hypothetical protein